MFYDKHSHWWHHDCQRIHAANTYKLQQMKSGVTHCEITGIEGGRYMAALYADHDHDTLLGRAVVCAALNDLEGAAKFIMRETGCDTAGIKVYLDNLYAKPGVDLGLKPYAGLGYATYEEAEAALNETTN